MSNIINIIDLRKELNDKKSIEEWLSFAQKQNIIIEQHQQQIKNLEFKNHQLENMLMTKFNKDLITELTPEESICIQQIDRLEKISIERALTLDEVKRLDLLVKNLKLIREESTIIVNQKPDGLKEADLVAIVRSDTTSNKSD